MYGGAFQSKYLNRVDTFLKRVEHHGYTTNVLTNTDTIIERDLKLWKSITDNSNHYLYDLLQLHKKEREIAKP